MMEQEVAIKVCPFCVAGTRSAGLQWCSQAHAQCKDSQPVCGCGSEPVRENRRQAAPRLDFSQSFFHPSNSNPVPCTSPACLAKNEELCCCE